MPVPLALAAPAAAAFLAYLNARIGLSYDLVLISSFLRGTLRWRLAELQNRVNLFYLLERHALSRRSANKTFFCFEGREWTYKETYEITLKYGTWLKNKHGIKPREIVAMDFMNSPEFIFLWLGLWSIGAQPAFINYNLGGQPLLHCVRTSTARLLLVDENVREKITPNVLDELSSPSFRENGGPTEVAFFDAAAISEIESTQGIRVPDEAREWAKPEDMAILIYTSGTTGLPKPAVVGWYKLILGGTFCSLWTTVRADDRIYTCMPLYHSSAVVLGFGTTLHAGTSICIGRKFSTRTFWKEVRQSNSTVIQYVGETCRYLLAAPPEIDPETGECLDSKNNVRLAFGNGLRPDVWEKFKTRFGIDAIGEFYAATEGMSGAWNLSRNDFTRGAIGRNGLLALMLLGYTVTVVKIDWETEQPWRDPKTGLCRKADTNEPGELLYYVKAKQIGKTYQGYFNDTKASNSKILRNVLNEGDAWFRTGDVVRWDAEGRWYFHDRIGDTFRWKSENVSTTEVSALLGHHPSVLEASVYGVALPNHDGRAGCAALVLSEPPSPKLLSSLAEHNLSSLPRYAVPLFLRITSSIQTTGTNKHQKHVLRKVGVDPANVPSTDQLYWLRDGTYVPFGARQWKEISGGAVKL
ncbi:very long-chain acyl-CoA synthetase/fatty acid transporter [Xylona heveae TC161]|uniref:Very long-chain fatty acid transport protein n=1 Tax=Xylona heveae (strain CBS 132557 / TC161) TaxID=1328760 RepID=A0A165JD63_XYLHT|nr:very long-chain acyl-CoA synthetase/fatty acid transporter [Xylona heveae TC161]KZF26078.1 very long-chain acyl-CoA synthetase/fatty acid transporter [Xylona heveae TC161]